MSDIIDRFFGGDKTVSLMAKVLFGSLNEFNG